MAEIEKKTCIKCLKELPMNEENFRRNSITKDGFEGQCKTCRKKYFEDYRAGKRIRGRRNRPKASPVRKSRKIFYEGDMKVKTPVLNASPAEIVVALRKGMAAEIVAMIREKFEL